jgi:hypothetical protein
MQEFSDRAAPHQLAFEAFGTQIRICTNDPDLLPRVESMMPPGWRRRPRSSAQPRLGLLYEGNDWYSLYRYDGACVHDAPGKEYALSMLDTQIQSHVAVEAPEFIFLHAGVVAEGSRAIVLPGLSFSGKTTLVRSLVEAGAVYYSDEYAVLDETGRVHPYAKPLSVRRLKQRTIDYRVDQLGGVAGVEPIPIGLVAAVRFRPGAKWDPRPLSTGAGALALLEHAVPAQDRPDQTIRYISRAIAGATAVQGERGEAEETAGMLLEALRATA